MNIMFIVSQGRNLPRSKLRRWWSKASNEVDAQTLDRIWIGTISRCARGYLAISQTELSIGSGVGRTTILSVERGATVPDSETASRLRDYFETAGIVADVYEDTLNVSYSGSVASGRRNSADIVEQSFARWKSARATRSRALRGNLAH